MNGSTFIQSAAINITGWSGNLSAVTYLWNNYTGSLQSMLPTGVGVKTNITQSSNLNLGVYNVSCNSSGNSTLTSKIFSVATMATTVPTTTIGGGNGNGGVTTTTTIGNQTTTSTTTTSQTTTTEVTTTISESTTTTIEEKPTGIKTWYIILIIIIFIMITIVIGYFKYKKKPMDTEFEQLKEKWKR